MREQSNITPRLPPRTSRLRLCRRPRGCLACLFVVVCFLLFGFVFFQMSLRVLAMWFLDVSFHGILTHGCYFGFGYYYFGVQNLSFGGLVPPLWHRSGLGTPWGTLRGALESLGARLERPWGTPREAKPGRADPKQGQSRKGLPRGPPRRPQIPRPHPRRHPKIIL